MALRNIFGPQRKQQEAGENYIISFITFAPLQMLLGRLNRERMRRTIYVAHMGEKKNAYRAFASKTARIRPLGKTGHRGENKIKMDLKLGWVLRRRLDSSDLE